MRKKQTLMHCTFLLLCIFHTVTSSAGEKKGETKSDFTLLKGVEPVCEAYLNRLNKSKFTYEWPPYCGRPEVVDMPHFDTLNRIYLNVEEIYRIFDLIKSFDNNSNQMYAKNIWKKSYLYTDKARSIKSLQQSVRLGRRVVWRYDPMVDVDNDGKPDNVVVWFEQRQNRCGGSDKNEDYPGMYAYVFNNDTTRIDEGKTLKVFGNSIQEDPISSQSYYRTINNENSFGIFKYLGITYFDTFPYGVTYGSAARGNVDLKVYLRQDDQTKTICQYHWNKKDL